MGVTTKTLLIGCGGSGLNTLMQLNALLASNADVRENMAECISYLVLDTDAGELGNFKATIDHQMGDVTPPIVNPVHLTKNVTRVEELVKPLKKLPADSEVAPMMKNYWWYSEEGRPFTGSEIKDLKAGAGQCPQVSFIATWKSMPEIKLIIDSMLNEIQKKNTHEGRALTNLRVFIVAGFAGGTGRGSWPLVAFKVRQCLLENKVDVPIDGVFFDAGCYPDASNEQLQNMFFNSATAISELSAWIRGKKFRALEGKPFRLPSLTLPKTDRTSDVINFDRVKGNETDFVAPVDSAYVVFGKNGGWTANLADPIQYYEMAAAALYAKIVNDEEIARRDSNARSNIGSFASATFGVDSVRIQVYLETAVQKEFLLSQFAKADQAMIDSVKKIVEGNGPVPDAESFLGKNHLWIPSDLKITGDNDPFGAETSLLHKMLKSLEKGMDDIFGPKEVKVGKSNSGEAEFALTSSLREALEKGDVNQVKDKVKKLKLDELTDSKVAGFLNTILAPEPEAAVKLDSEHLAETLRTLAMEMFDQDNVLSLRRTVLFVEKLTDLFSGYSKTLASCDGKVDDLITKFNEEVDKASAFDLHGFAVWGNRFNKAEIRNLCKQFELKVREALLIRIRGVLKDFFDGAVKELKNIKGRLDLMSEFLEESGRLLEANLKPVFRDKPYEDIFNELFIDPEVEGSVLGAIPKADDVQLLYKRSLKPILSRDKLRNLLRDKENYDPGNRKGIKQCITDALLDLLTGEYESEDDAWDEIPTKISDVIVANVRLKADSAGLSFIDRHFSFRKVLDDNTKVWGELLANIPVGKVGDLHDRLRGYLGVEPKDFKKGRSSGNIRIPDEALVPGIVRSLMTVCKPWIQISADTPPSLTCLVVLPLEEFGKYEETLKAEIKAMYAANGFDLQPTFLYPRQDVAKSIPRDRILVFTSELLGFEQCDGAPVGKIESLAYWQDYADLLKLAEDLDHNSAALFSQDDRMYGAGNWGEKPRTFAFLAPLFTMEPYRDLRWHPWIDAEVNQEKEQLDEVYKLLFYALLGHAVDENGDPAPVKEACPVGENGFTLPLISMQDRGSDHAFVFLRTPLEKQKTGEMGESITPVWDKGQELEDSLDHVVEFLNGQGKCKYRAKGGPDLQESVDEGKKIRLALSNEAAVFFDGIKRDIGSAYEKLVTDCVQWLFKQSKIKGKEQECWQRLLEVAKKEME